MLGLMQYPQRVLLHKQQKIPRTFLAILKYVATQQPTDRQFRYSNCPIRCSTQLCRYYGRYHEHPPLGLLYMLFFAGNVRDLDHTLLGQIPKKVVPHVNVLTPARAKQILCKLSLIHI